MENSSICRQQQLSPASERIVHMFGEEVNGHGRCREAQERATEALVEVCLPDLVNAFYSCFEAQGFKTTRQTGDNRFNGRFICCRNTHIC